jgi:hypothetical protein
MATSAKPTLTAADVKEALRRRHPATARMGSRTIPGPWTTTEEFMGIDLLAWSANSSPSSGAQRNVPHPLVGYEVKISRSDLRHELLRPGKRLRARSFCHEFYLAVPKGLLMAEEIAWDEPEWMDDYTSFVREPCPNGCHPIGRARKTTYVWDPEAREQVRCPVCKGKGTLAGSRVEREAPTLWVPRDLGLIEVDGRGCKVTKRSPINRKASEPQLYTPAELSALVRWVSARPDPRHAGVVASDRAHSREIAARQRQREGR